MSRPAAQAAFASRLRQPRSADVRSPWLIVSCPTPFYNLSGRRWARSLRSRSLRTAGELRGGRGRTLLVKIVPTRGTPSGPPLRLLLQNIATGQFEPDPPFRRDRLDDLNAPSGSVPLCSLLHYPSDDGRGGLSSPAHLLRTVRGDVRVLLRKWKWPGLEPTQVRIQARLDISDVTNGHAPVASSVWWS